MMKSILHWLYKGTKDDKKYLGKYWRFLNLLTTARCISKRLWRRHRFFNWKKLFVHLLKTRNDNKVREPVSILINGDWLATCGQLPYVMF